MIKDSQKREYQITASLMIHSWSELSASSPDKKGARVFLPDSDRIDLTDKALAVRHLDYHQLTNKYEALPVSNTTTPERVHVASSRERAGHVVIDSQGVHLEERMGKETDLLTPTSAVLRSPPRNERFPGSELAGLSFLQNSSCRPWAEVDYKAFDELSGSTSEESKSKRVCKETHLLGLDTVDGESDSENSLCMQFFNIGMEVRRSVGVAMPPKCNSIDSSTSESTLRVTVPVTKRVIGKYTHQLEARSRHSTGHFVTPPRKTRDRTQEEEKLSFVRSFATPPRNAMSVSFP